MAKIKTRYLCQSCGAVFPKWYGRCPECGTWNSLVEEVVEQRASSTDATRASAAAVNPPQPLRDIQSLKGKRLLTGVTELDRVLGGGFVPGSIVLLGGEPGIGKSTLALQLAFSSGLNVLYVSGEESLEQIKLRSLRLGVKDSDKVTFLSETLLENILAAVEQVKPQLVIIDSIQTTQTDTLESSPGTVTQIRECTTQIQRFAKKHAITFLLIGHITKEGQIAGPKVLEHIVDAVLQFEGDRNYFYRILRSVKNRFGSTSELGIFEMNDRGLKAVDNPSQILMSPSSDPVSGVSISASIEGLRPFMIEVQALVSTAVYGTPQRSAIGFDVRRMNMLIAVVEKRLGLRLGNKDVFLNIAGGIKVDDPAIDLSVVASIISSDKDIAIPKKVCFAAEVGLTGEIRPVNRLDQRIKEAGKLGFEVIFVSAYSRFSYKPQSIKIIKIANVSQLFAHIMKMQ